jgi:hypothetical protein
MQQGVTAPVSRPPLPTAPNELADEIEAVVEENVLRTFKVLQEGKQDVPAFERAISKMLAYIRQGSVTNKLPQVLMSELNGYCNPTDNPLWTEFITGLCKTYQKFYENESPRLRNAPGSFRPNGNRNRTGRSPLLQRQRIALNGHPSGLLVRAPRSPSKRCNMLRNLPRLGTRPC